jgi:hypothetical protein
VTDPPFVSLALQPDTSVLGCFHVGLLPWVLAFGATAKVSMNTARIAARQI